MCVSDGVVALHAAARSGDLAAVRALLADGVPAHAQADEDGTSALMHAAGGGHGEVVSALLEAGAPWNAIDRRGRCAGNHALDAGHQTVVDALVDAATRAELLLGAAQRGTKQAALAAEESQQYLSRGVRYDGDRLLDDADDAVMMEWEAPLMEAHAARLCAGAGRASAVLNVGFGMGIVDRAIQAHGPALHAIIEAHPGVHERMRADGWDAKQGVRLELCRWQDAIPRLVAEGVKFDGIFYDTYGEHDADMQEFHSHLPALLAPGGVYSFFNGLCPFNVFFQGVACAVIQLELGALGLEVSFEPMAVDVKHGVGADAVGNPHGGGGGADEAGGQWEGVRRKYFYSDTYYLPHCVLARDGGEAGGGEAGGEAPDLAVQFGPGQAAARGRAVIEDQRLGVGTGGEGGGEHGVQMGRPVGKAGHDPLPIVPFPAQRKVPGVTARFPAPACCAALLHVSGP